MGIYFYSNKNYSFLSNFHPAPFVLDKRLWPTVEHYYQAQKTTSLSEQEKIRSLPRPGQAKRAGRKIKLQKGWEKIKEDVMQKALYAKFSQNPSLKEKLLATGDESLHEDSPYDFYWGAKGQDRLGKLLAEIRDALRKEAAQ
ncbi:MAG: hypothetical protein AVO34_06925 [Firmicutes bacterium ML8_F2]|jgi:N-glycosidase YbiA|nr:MAG: hypothetical protein AVO34_06925 [Firmicutes bacterium ML8_F2]